LVRVHADRAAANLDCGDSRGNNVCDIADPLREGVPAAEA
jgi:hypothetical protein